MSEVAVSASAVSLGPEPHAHVHYVDEFATGKDVTVTNANEWYDVTNEGTLVRGAEGFTYTVASGKVTASELLGDCEVDVDVTLNSTTDATSTISAGLRRNAAASTTAPEAGAQNSMLNTAAAGVTPPASVRTMSFTAKLLDVRKDDFFTLSVSSSSAGDVVKVRQFHMRFRQIPAFKGTRA